MGADGIGPFDNDFAEDFCANLQQSDGSQIVQLLRAALDAAASTPVDAYLERDVGEVAVAASAIAVAARLGRQEVLEEADVVSVMPPVPDDIFPLVVAAINRTLQSDSEIRRLWEQVGAGEEWAEGLKRLSVEAASLNP